MGFSAALAISEFYSNFGVSLLLKFLTPPLKRQKPTSQSALIPFRPSNETLKSSLSLRPVFQQFIPPLQFANNEASALTFFCLIRRRGFPSKHTREVWAHGSVGRTRCFIWFKRGWSGVRGCYVRTTSTLIRSVYRHSIKSGRMSQKVRIDVSLGITAVEAKTDKCEILTRFPGSRKIDPFNNRVSFSADNERIHIVRNKASFA